MEHVVKLWEGGGRAMGAEWKSDMYTREGLKNVGMLRHSLQQARSFSSTAKRLFSNSANRFFSSMTVQKFDEEAYGSAIKSGYNDFEASLTLGGDDRSIINSAVRTNKYHIKPQPVNPAHVFRGSCTGNPPTQRGYDASRKLYQKLVGLSGKDLDAEIGKVFEDQRNRLSKLLSLPEGTEIILCPSGSDAEYIPIAIARALKGEVTIANGVTQLREIGAGTAPASMGQFFSTHAPLVGRLDPNADILDGFEDIDGTVIAARKKDGSVVNASKEMDSFVESALANGAYPIVHGVFGGKTGLRDNKMPGSADGGEKTLGVVDACQARFSLEELHGWLAQDSLVLFTASKFYQAPPFCGAVIVPTTIAGKLRSSSTPPRSNMFSSQGLGGFLTNKELPSCLESWSPLLKNDDISNVGLAFRWEAGLAGMEAIASVPDAARIDAVNEWAEVVTAMTNSEQALDAWCVQRSIVSIRVRKGEGWLSMSELRDLYRWMSLDVSELVPDATAKEKEALSNPAYIGQPVDVSESHAIVRIALGVESLLSYLDDKDTTLSEDQMVVKKLAAIGKHFDVLKESGW